MFECESHNIIKILSRITILKARLLIFFVFAQKLSAYEVKIYR